MISTLSSSPINLSVPLKDELLASLTAGQGVLISGQLVVARDQAHKRLIDLVRGGEKLPFDPEGQIIYYMGPSPAPPGAIIGSAGPTTAGRMDSFTAPLLELGVKALLGKGRRSAPVKEALEKNRAVYLGAVGGAGALYSRHIRSLETLAWPELGPEALLRLSVTDLPATVIYDLHGGDLYESGPAFWREKLS